MTDYDHEAFDWECACCGEMVPEDFDVCWSCGTSRDGVIDPGFTPADKDYSARRMSRQQVVWTMAGIFASAAVLILWLLDLDALAMGLLVTMLAVYIGRAMQRPV